MKENVIILTSGLSGSSVLTALISRAGYWTGDDTFDKPEYKTFENTGLIERNRSLFKEAGCSDSYTYEFLPEAITTIASLTSKIDPEPYRVFVNHCNAHQPWIWKDPRLWMTIRFWNKLLDGERCKFILLTRSSSQIWTSSILRGLIMSYRYSKTYEANIRNSIVGFLEGNRYPYLHVRYDALISDPERSIAELNQYLGTALTVEDLRKVYREPLYKTPGNSWQKYVKAMLIYLKNFSQRLDIA